MRNQSALSSTAGSLRRAWARRCFAVIVSLGAVSAVGYAVAPSVAADGGIQPAGTLTNYFYAHNTGIGFVSETTSPMLDPANHILFETVPGSALCPSMVAMDPDTFAVLATNGRYSNGFCAPTVSLDTPAPTGGTAPPTLTYDSTDGVLLGASVFQNPVAQNTLIAMSEKSLDHIATWTLPSGMNEKYIAAVSWYAPLDELLVLTSFGDTGLNGGVVPPGVSLIAFNVKDNLASAAASGGSATLNPAWEAVNVSGCQNTLVPSYGSAAAYHAGHDSAAYVPCQLTHIGATGAASVERDGVVRVPLSRTGCANGAPECTDMNHPQTSAAAPGRANDVYFDPGIDRAFMPFQQAGGLDALIYDGKDGLFEGQASLGSIAQCDASSGSTNQFGSQIGLDTVTGRVYTTTIAGLLSLEGRETPLEPGTDFTQYGAQVPSGTTAILPPDKRFPYTRLLVSHTVNFCNTSTANEPYFSVYADTRPAAPPPPPADVDQGTYQGKIAPGTPLSITYGAQGRGFGAHFDLVASLNGPVINAGQEGTVAQVSSVPFGNGNRNLLLGDVASLSLNDGSAQGAATAVGDGDSTTAQELGTCTNLNAPRNCASGPSQPSALDTVPVTPPSPPSPPSVEATAQLWPSPLSSCSYPGAGGTSQHWDGLYSTSYTTPSPSPGSSDTPAPEPTQNQAPNSSSLAHSQVNCVGDAGQNNSIAADAFVKGMEISSGYTLSVASTSSSVTVTPPDQTTHTAQAVVTSIARGIKLVNGGSELFDIGEIVHTATATASGSAGGATTINKVTMENVSIAGTDYCTSNCDVRAVLTQLSTQFPTLLFSTSPQPAAPYNTTADGYPKGSPGGYQAVVESTNTNLYGDEQFNGMSTEEASQVPGLRIIVYGFRDGDPKDSRLVADFAGLEADAEVGIQPASDLAPPPPPVDTTQASLDSTGFSAPPFEPATVQQQQSPPQVVDVPTPGGVLGYVVRAFHGLDWLVRSPGAALQMAAFLMLLGLPLIMMRRRGAAIGDV